MVIEHAVAEAQAKSSAEMWEKFTCSLWRTARRECYLGLNFRALRGASPCPTPGTSSSFGAGCRMPPTDLHTVAFFAAFRLASTCFSVVFRWRLSRRSRSRTPRIESPGWRLLLSVADSRSSHPRIRNTAVFELPDLVYQLSRVTVMAHDKSPIKCLELSDERRRMPLGRGS